MSVKRTVCHLTDMLKRKNAPPVLCIGGDILKQVHVAKFRGLYIDDKLDWNKQIEHVRNQVSSGLYAMNAARHLLSSVHLRILYNSLVQPYLSYGTILLGNAYSKHLHL